MDSSTLQLVIWDVQFCQSTSLARDRVGHCGLERPQKHYFPIDTKYGWKERWRRRSRREISGEEFYTWFSLEGWRRVSLRSEHLVLVRWKPCSPCFDLTVSYEYCTMIELEEETRKEKRLWLLQLKCRPLSHLCIEEIDVPPRKPNKILSFYCCSSFSL